jgi:Domain of unknown function (DUF4380)
MEDATVETAPHLCNIGLEDYHGWSALRLGNGIIDLIVVPSIGGRIIQLRLGADEYLYVNPRHLGRVYDASQNHSGSGWKNYGGSKVWPAPQGWLSDSEWPGPPDPVLDGGNYGWEITENEPGQVALALTSPADEYTGLTLQREIRLASDSAGIRIRHRMRNTSLRPVRWGVWQVTQQVAGRSFAVFVPAKTYRQTLGDRPFRSINLNRGLLRLDYTGQVAKFVVKVDEGWVGSLDSARGLALIERFGMFPEANYADEAPVALWVNGPGTYTIHDESFAAEDDPNGCDSYVETEVLSPLVSLEPGEEYTFDVWWHCARVRAGEIERANSCGVVSRALGVAPENGSLRVTGAFGVFQNGTAELACIRKDGQVAALQTAGPVTPLAPCRVEALIPRLEALFRVSLRVRNRSGELLGTIASAQVDSSGS